MLSYEFETVHGFVRRGYGVREKTLDDNRGCGCYTPAMLDDIRILE